MFRFLRKLIGMGATRVVYAEASGERKVRVLEDTPVIGSRSSSR